MAWNGVLPAGNGDPAIAVSTPVPGAMENPPTAAEFRSVTYRNFVLGSMARPPFPGAGPAGNGEPGIGFSAPVLESIVKPSIVPFRKSETYRNDPDGSATIPSLWFGPDRLPSDVSAPLVATL